MIVFPVPPVCTAKWTENDWKHYEEMYGVETKPETITNSFGVWKKTGKTDINGHALYNLNQEV